MDFGGAGDEDEDGGFGGGCTRTNELAEAMRTDKRTGGDDCGKDGDSRGRASGIRGTLSGVSILPAAGAIFFVAAVLSGFCMRAGLGVGKSEYCQGEKVPKPPICSAGLPGSIYVQAFGACLPLLFWGCGRGTSSRVGQTERSCLRAVSLLRASFLLTHHSVQVRYLDSVSFPLHTI